VRLFGWDVLRLAALCQQWAASGELLSGVPVEGWAGDYLAWSSITSDMTAATCL
jgi:hypothetical protein